MEGSPAIGIGKTKSVNPFPYGELTKEDEVVKVIIASKIFECEFPEKKTYTYNVCVCSVCSLRASLRCVSINIFYSGVIISVAASSTEF